MLEDVMPLGQSVPIATPLAAIAGVICGEIALAIAKNKGCNEITQRVVTGVAHAVASATTGYCINAALGVDVTGAVVTTGQTAATAVGHAAIAHVSGHAIGPGVLRF
jgi:hypothetical protein